MSQRIAAAVCIVGLWVVPCAEAAPLEKLPEGVQLVAVEAFPASVELKNRFDYRQLLLTARTAAGEQLDVTRMATIEPSGGFVTISDRGLVRPASDGEGQIRCLVGDKTVSIPVKVTGHAAPYDVNYVRDVTPAMSKLGCNAGTCHGSAKGKNGFKLSLRGYDPVFDHRALTDDIESRRFNRAAPEQSLMLLKASGEIPHVGGTLTRPGEPYYELLKQWIGSGVNLDLNVPRVTKIEVFPKNPIVPLPKMTQQIAVMATYSDGSTRDVSAEAFVESGNIETIEADKRGLLTMLRRGEAPVLVRYEGAYAATTLTVMGDRSGFAWEQPPANNYIDELVYKKLQRVKTAPGVLCSDDDFIRRAYLDLTGLPPSAEAVRAFAADSRETRVKRDELIDKLVGSPEYVEQWTNKWADLLQVNRKFLGEEGAVTFRNWIRGAVAANMPYDQMVRTILTASGSNQKNPPASYFKTLRTPVDTMENTTQLFLAVRFNCNKCHDHPFERWTQNQYYRLAAYFAHVGFKPDPAAGNRKIGGSAVEGAKDLFEIIYDTGGGEVKHEGTGQVAPPTFPYDHADKLSADRPRREQLAHWIASKDNQYFAKSYVNRLWGYMLGVGLIEPIDDIRAGNPPTNPELLDALTKDFVEHNFDVQHMMRTICKSRTYQMSIVTNKWNDDDTINYSHALARRLPAEALYDAIHVATGSTPRLPGVPAGFRAAQLPDAGVSLPFLDDFGRPPRESACECERSGGVMLAPVMKLVNGPTVSDAIADPNNAIAKLVASQPDDAKVVEELYLRFLARRPTERQLAEGIETLRTAGDDYTKLLADFRQLQTAIDAKQAEWERTAGAGAVWTPLAASEVKTKAGATITAGPDNIIRVDGKLAKDIYTITAPTDLAGVTGIRLEALASNRLPARGPGRAPNGNFVVNELRLTAAPKSDAKNAQAVIFQGGIHTYAQNGFSAAGVIDGNPNSGWAIDPRAGQDHAIILETKENVGQPGGTQLVFTLEQNFPDGKHTLGKFRLSVTTSKRPLRFDGPPAEIAAILDVPADKRSPEQQAKLAEYHRALDPQYARIAKEAREAEALEKNKRLAGAQDLAWALINNPAFLFNR
jgi:hypothetical protein